VPYGYPRKVMAATTPSSDSPPTVIAVANAKGGVGKTSIVANLGGITALAGWRVLVVDLDPQGNLAADLGYNDRSDHGASLARTLTDGSSPITLRSVRDRLDAWAGGPALGGLIRSALIPELDEPLAKAIAAADPGYDFVYIDCPPALGPLVDAALGAADFLLIPIRADHASLSGVQLIAERFRQAHTTNPRLELMGVTLFDVSRQATAIVREVADALAAGFHELSPRLLPAIRRSERSAFDMRREGILAYEYEEAKHGPNVVTLAQRIETERAGRRSDPGPAARLSSDYFDLARSVLSLANQRHRRTRRTD
jgi:cellulose biosynthesis protein BcsQ